MKKILVALFALMPLVSMAQSNTTLTPEQQLEAAQKQLEAAQKAVEQAKANAEKAKKAAAEAKAKAEAQAKAEREAAEKRAKEIAARQAEIQEQIKKAQEEAARLNAEADRLNKEAQQINSSTTTVTPSTTAPETKKEVTQPAAETKPVVVAEPAKTVVATPKTTTTPKVTSSPRVTNTKKYVKAKKNDVVDMSQYLEGAVPVVDGKVTFTLDLDVPGKSADEIYTVAKDYLTELTDDDNQMTEGKQHSQVVLSEESDHQVAARMCEWLVFQSNFISLDRSEFYYTLVANCSDNHLNMTFSRISYVYDQGRDTGFKEKAEDWIVDDLGLNKKKDKLSRLSGKFRRATIDRKNEVFDGITEALQ